MSKELVNKTVNQLLNDLRSATKLAQVIGLYSQKEDAGEWFEGTEALDVGEELENIYAALMTGNPFDKSLNDQIFK